MDRFSRENSCTICHDYGSSECGCPSDAQAKIARLQAELERTNDVLESQAHVIRDLRSKLDDARNAAIEAAAIVADHYANTDYCAMGYPEDGGIAAIGTAYTISGAIRALKRPT